ncbi:hypothetical protein NECID01_0578 [Nematocida sp. AWRm77]|nr:hypothetical protein NECID01_0578 [Nematocida sp. AWRm77]
MQTIAVIDASVIINGTIRNVQYNQGYMPECVMEEVKCALGKERLLHQTHRIEVRNPEEKYIDQAQAKAQELGYTCLSRQDISLAALALELSEEIPSVYSSWITPDAQPAHQVICATSDMALKVLLVHLGVCTHDEFAGDDRKYLQRCYTCGKVFTGAAKQDFCTHCGYTTITRVSYTTEDNKINLFLKKEFKHKERHITFKGKEIRGQDQKEYKWYRATQNRKEREEQKQTRLLEKEDEWCI